MMEKYFELPVCLPYHPLSELGERPGYYPNISAEQLKASRDLIRLVEKENLRFNIDEEHEFLKLLRFLRARKFNVNDAFNMIKEDVKWRCEENRLNLRQETAEEVLGCNVGELYKYFPTWIQGKDKQLRPVSYRQFGRFEIWNVLKITTMQRLIRFHAWETEQALRFMHNQSRKIQYNIETFVLVIDAAGWNMGLATRDAFQFIKGMAVTDSDHYPERLGTMIIINAPTALAFAWGVVQGFLDPVTKAKVRIIGSNQADWLPILLEYIDQNEIPEQYGGFSPDPTPEDAIKNMNPNIATENEDEKPKVLMFDQGCQTDDPFQSLEDEASNSCHCVLC
jgi:hypothetical protein